VNIDSVVLRCKKYIYVNVRFDRMRIDERNSVGLDENFRAGTTENENRVAGDQSVDEHTYAASDS